MQLEVAEYKYKRQRASVEKWCDEESLSFFRSLETGSVGEVEERKRRKWKSTATNPIQRHFLARPYHGVCAMETPADVHVRS